jgi:tripartite ATP-independent transporter DctM subunit
MEIILIALVVLFFILVGTPLFAVVGGAAMFCFAFISDIKMAVVIGEMWKIANAPGIVAIPLFIFAGYIFAESNTSKRLVNMSRAFLGWLPGGLGIVTVIACTIFTSMTGASGITIVAIGGLLMPALLSENYAKDFSLGLVTSGGTIGVLFIPSLPIIIYGLIAHADISQLFVAGVLPGLLVILLLSTYLGYYGVKNKTKKIPFSASTLFRALNEAKWELPIVVIIIGGIYGAIITVGEAATVTAVYAIFVECIIYKEVSFIKLIDIIFESMKMVGAILIIMGCALGFTNYLVDQHVPQTIMEVLQSHISSKLVFLLGLNAFLLVVGCLLDVFSAIIVVVPLIVPVAMSYNVDPIHLGIIFLTNLSVGYLTPPVGMNLFVASLRFKAPILKLYVYVLPFLLIFLVALVLVTYIPWLSLFLIDALGQRPPLLDL